jgi:hypothetical protein
MDGLQTIHPHLASAQSIAHSSRQDAPGRPRTFFAPQEQPHSNGRVRAPQGYPEAITSTGVCSVMTGLSGTDPVPIGTQTGLF